MMRRNDEGNRWTGAVLVALQLVALLVLPLLHVPAVAAEVPALEKSGAPAEPHSEATCSICRVAGLRYAAPPDHARVLAPPAAPVRGTPAERVEYRTVVRITSIAARAPPLSL